MTDFTCERCDSSISYCFMYDGDMSMQLQEYGDQYCFQSEHDGL